MNMDKLPTELVSKEVWEERHKSQTRFSVYPKPCLYYLDYELDQVFRDYLSNKTGRTMLEAGCGSSAWLPYFVREFGLKVSGIDYSETGLEVSRQILEQNKVEGRLILADFLKMTGDFSGSFDFVFSLGVVEHFENSLRVLEKLKDFLSPAGLLITWVPNLSGLIQRFNHFFNKELTDFYGSLDPEKLLELHRKLDLEVVEARFIQFFDLMLFNLNKLPPFARRGLARFFRAVGLVFILLGKSLNFHIRHKAFCAGFVVVARKRKKA